jgi:hypothetical protein
MLLPPGRSPTTTAARQRRAAERFAQARMRVLDRNGLTEVDITNMTEAEAERSTLGRQMLFELAHSDWSEEQSEIENKLRKQEDEADVASRRDMVLAENARTAGPA